MSRLFLFKKFTPVLSTSRATQSISEGGATSLNNVFNGAMHPTMAVPGNHGLHGSGARYLNSIPYPHAAAKVSSPRMSSRIFSSSATTKDQLSTESQIKAMGADFRKDMKNMRRIWCFTGISLSIISFYEGLRYGSRS